MKVEARVVELDGRRQPATEEWPTAEARRAAALEHAAAEAAAGRPPSGAELGRLYDRSERWGRQVLEDLDGGNRQAGTTGTGNPAGSGSPAGSPGSGRQPAPDAGRQPPGSRHSRAAGTGNRPPAGSRPAARSAAAGKRQPPPAAGTGRRLWAWLGARVDGAAAVAVALVAAAASYGHMHEVALRAGEPDWIAWLWPITVDGLAIVALRRRGKHGRRWLCLALVVSVAANVLTNYPAAIETVAPLIKAWPPVALYGTHRLLHTAH